MEQRIVKIKSIEKVTHDVLQIVTEKPLTYTFTPGQATDVSINNTDWKYEKRPFTFTCLFRQHSLQKTRTLKKRTSQRLRQFF